MDLMLMLALSVAAPAPAAARESATDTVVVVTLNIWHDQREWPRRRSMIVEGLRVLRPDVICLQEVLQHATLPNQATTLAESLGCSAHFTSVDPEGAPKRYGNAILTPHRVLSAGGKALDPKDDYRTVAHARIDVRGRPLDVYDTHLHHTLEGGAIRAEQVLDLLAFVDSTRGKEAFVLAGDFNAELGSPELRPIEDACLDAWAATHPGARGTEAVTINQALGNVPRSIDHVFIPRRSDSALAPTSAEIIFREPAADSLWASDHFGVVARLARPTRGEKSPAPPPRPGLRRRPAEGKPSPPRLGRGVRSPDP